MRKVFSRLKWEQPPGISLIPSIRTRHFRNSDGSRRSFHGTATHTLTAPENPLRTRNELNNMVIARAEKLRALLLEL
jgi:hypothetical protein